MPYPCWYCKLVQPWFIWGVMTTCWSWRILEIWHAEYIKAWHAKSPIQPLARGEGRGGGRSYSLVKVSIYKRVRRSRQSCKLHKLNGVPFLNRRYKIGVPYLLKIVYKRGRGWASPFITFPEDLSPRGYKKKKRNITFLPTGVLVLSISRQLVACFRFWHFGEDTLFRGLRLGVNALFGGLRLGDLHGETLFRGLFGWYSGEDSRSAAHSTLSLLRFLPGLELLSGCRQPLTSNVYQETRTKSQTL